MTPREIDVLMHQYLGIDGGYLLGGGGWSYGDHEEFYARYCDLEIDVVGKRESLRFLERKATTAATFRAILEESPPTVQAKIIRGTLERVPVDSWPDELVAKKQPVAERLMVIVTRLESEVVPGIFPAATSETVHLALKNAEELLKTHGPISAIDRVHTALHGHVRYLCQQAGITLDASEPTATQYVKSLLNEHPALQVEHPNREAIKSIVRTSFAIIDAAGTLRNNASVAHPNDDLLAADEARLLINVTRSVMHYIDAKLQA